MEENKQLKETLNEVGIDLVKTLVKNLLAADKKATGQLIRSIDYKVVEKAQSVMVELIAADYLTIVDEGRRPGKQPPTKALDKWVIARGIAPRDKKGRFIPRESVKFLIARSIGRNGIRPTGVLQKTIDEVYAKKQKVLELAAIDDINKMIDKIIK